MRRAVPQRGAVHLQAHRQGLQGRRVRTDGGPEALQGARLARHRAHHLPRHGHGNVHAARGRVELSLRRHAARQGGRLRLCGRIDRRGVRGVV